MPSIPAHAGLSGPRFACAFFLASLSLLVNCDLRISEQVIQGVSSLYGAPAGERMRAWYRVIQRHAGDGETEKLRLVNAFFNRLPAAADQRLWGKEDYWATPIEALGINGADCEDYSLAKYFTLISMGVPETKLHITYVKALELNEAHMVLAYYPSPEAEPLILDNLKGEILSASRRPDLLPVYSFNGKGLWTSVNRARGKRVGSADRIDLWNDFLSRFKQQLGSG